MAANKINAETKRKFLTVYIPDTRGVEISRYGRGNLKLGMDGVYTYSRLPGHPSRQALGAGYADEFVAGLDQMRGTCPGATEECQAICYAARPVAEHGAVERMWRENSIREDVPPIPEDCKILRIHVSGDFTSVDYIRNWYLRLAGRPDVRAFAYTRSWRVPELLPALQELHRTPNLQLFASMDKSTIELPPFGWRRAWMADDERLSIIDVEQERNHTVYNHADATEVADIIGMSYTCPEQTGHKASCAECRYCIDGQHNDVTFLKH